MRMGSSWRHSLALPGMSVLVGTGIPGYRCHTVVDVRQQPPPRSDLVSKSEAAVA
ncbi:hypothetical protein [Phyllobacterium endophyticum]|uniref:hypothetical protein n=1 Tax=Phyllobacterium endophyticum TaxID=1149773 RepID=UPI0016502544|nr:hypothetical protein [Phyllobacterium endophyticum]